MEGLPERLPVRQVTLKSNLPDLKIYLSRTTGRDFCQALYTNKTRSFKVGEGGYMKRPPGIVGPV